MLALIPGCKGNAGSEEDAGPADTSWPGSRWQCPVLTCTQAASATFPRCAVPPLIPCAARICDCVAAVEPYPGEPLLGARCHTHLGRPRCHSHVLRVSPTQPRWDPPWRRRAAIGLVARTPLWYPHPPVDGIDAREPVSSFSGFPQLPWPSDDRQIAGIPPVLVTHLAAPSRLTNSQS